MAKTTRRTHTTDEGPISGYLLKLCRAAAGLDQQSFAERAGVGVTTVQGWESGRTPLTAVQVGRFTGLRHQLLHAGTPVTLLSALQVALDVDHLISHAIGQSDTAPTLDTHPLATWVVPKAAADLFAWALGGDAPHSVQATGARSRRNGPTPTRPNVPADLRARIINHLRCITELPSSRSEPRQLLWRQAFYLLGYDRDSESISFLRRTGARTVQTQHPSVATLAATRSIATAQARCGDPDQLRWFIERTSGEDHAERVNLAYWAYWLGELPGPQRDDQFMAATEPVDFGGATLLKHLTHRLLPHLGYIDLTVHTLWSLTTVKPHLLAEHPATARVVFQRTAELLDHSGQLSPRVRQEVTEIRHALRLASHR